MERKKKFKPSIKGLYQLKKSDIHRGSQIMSRAFQNDPIWDLIITDDPDGSKLAQFFQIPMFYSLKYGQVYATSEELEGIAVWLPGKYSDMHFWGLIRSGAIFPALKVGNEIGTKVDRIFHSLSVDREKNIQEPYYYLFILGIDPNYQKKGFASKLLKPFIEQADKEGLPLCLETEKESLVTFYEHFGFQLVQRVVLPEVNVPMWEMIRHPNS